jgi:hypothetical protein
MRSVRRRERSGDSIMRPPPGKRRRGQKGTISALPFEGSRLGHLSVTTLEMSQSTTSVRSPFATPSAR